MATGPPSFPDIKHLFLALVRQMPVAAAIFDREMRCLEASDRWCAAWELTPDQRSGARLYDQFPEISAESRQRLERCLAGESGRIEYGRIIWELRPWGSVPAEPDGILIFAEEPARDTPAPNAKIQTRYKGLLEHSNEGIARCRMIFENGIPVDFIYLEVNPRFGELTGLHDVIGRRVTEVIPGIQHTDPEIFEIYSRIARTGEPVKFEFYVKALAQWFLVSAFSSEPGCFTAIFSVITEGKRVEQDLARSNEEFLAVVNNSPAGIARLDLHGRFTFVNPRMAELARCKPGDLIGQPEGSFDLGDSHLWFRMVRHVVETHRRLTTEYFFPRGLIDDGIKVLVQFVPECDSSGAMRAILMFATDVTELQRAQTIASERGSILETLFETAAQGIFAVDADGTIRLANRMAEQMFGYEPGDLLNQPHEILLPEEIRVKHAADRQAYLAAPKRRFMGPRREFLARRKDGSWFPVEISLSYVNSRYGVLGVSFITDITSRNQQEEELRTLRARVLAAQEDASRELARELHDDITQRLAFLSVEIGKAATLPDQPNALIRKLKSFQERIQELSEGVRQISHRLHPSVLDHLGLSAALEELCIITEEAGSLTIHFDARDVPEAVGTATASSLYRVCQECMSNILKHARAESVNVLLAAEGDTLRLVIDDDGVGFDPELARSGVGTYSMRERVRLLNGNLSMESEPGKGTRVRVIVPLTLRPSEEHSA